MLFGEYIRLMALVEYSAEEIKTVFADFPGLEVCVYAAPSQTVIGGPPSRSTRSSPAPNPRASSPASCRPRAPATRSRWTRCWASCPAESRASNRTRCRRLLLDGARGQVIRPGAEPIHDVDYWKKGMRHSVYFTHGIRNAVDNGHTTFLELAPNPVALMQVGLTTGGRPA